MAIKYFYRNSFDCDEMLSIIYSSVMKLKDTIYISGVNNKFITLRLTKLIAAVGVGRSFLIIGTGYEVIKPYEKPTQEQLELIENRKNNNSHEWCKKACEYEKNTIKSIEMIQKIWV